MGLKSTIMTQTSELQYVALFIQEERAEGKKITLNISNCYIVFNDASVDMDGVPKISTVLFSNVSSVYIHNSTIEHNTATGILTLSSIFHFIGHNTLRNNSAILGGALPFVDIDSMMYLHPDSVLRIIGNRASTYGGGIAINRGFVKDYAAPCFYQLIPKDSAHILSSGAVVIMEGNNATMAGHSLYGGDGQSCIQLHQNLVHQSQRVPSCVILSTTFLLGDTRDSDSSSVALGLCFCTENNPYACNFSVTMRHLHIYPGERFTIEAIGLGYGGTIAPAIISHRVENLSTNKKSMPNVTVVNSGPQTVGTICRHHSYQLEAPENMTNIGIRLVTEGSVSFCILPTFEHHYPILSCWISGKGE